MKWFRSSKQSSSNAPKAPFSFQGNVLPVVIGIFAFVGVMGLLNGQWILAQADYRFAPQMPSISPAKLANLQNTKAPNNNSEIIIPSINVDAPIITNITSYADWAVQIGLRSGVVHYGKTALPGQKGNIVIVGHSSEVPWAPGNYKFVFTLLNKLKTGDQIYVDYQGTRYTYKVMSSEVVDPNNFSVTQPTHDAELTLITCTPVGTDWHRLVVHAEQISPNPRFDSAAPSAAQQASNNKLPQ